jgi:hypothetical protein
VAREYSQVIDIDPLIETYRVEYAKDLETRLNLNVTKLPPALAISTLLNPLFGLEATIVGSGLMTEEQYATARNLVIRMLHDIIDKGSVVAVDDSSSELDSSDDEILPPTEDANYTKASNEFSLFEKKVKKKKYLPELIKSASGSLSGEFRGKPKAIWVAPVAKKGKDLFSKKNLADYIDERGRMQLLKFFGDHQKPFPTINILVQKEASRRLVEVGCERLFGLSGYVSSPRRTRLGVCNYERLAMLSSIVQNVYVDPKWVAEEYLRRCKLNKWKKADDDDALKCFNCERIVEAKQFGLPKPAELTMADITFD